MDTPIVDTPFGPARLPSFPSILRVNVAHVSTGARERESKHGNEIFTLEPPVHLYTFVTG